MKKSEVFNYLVIKELDLEKTFSNVKRKQIENKVEKLMYKEGTYENKLFELYVNLYEEEDEVIRKDLRQRILKLVPNDYDIKSDIIFYSVSSPVVKIRELEELLDRYTDDDRLTFNVGIHGMYTSTNPYIDECINFAKENNVTYAHILSLGYKGKKLLSQITKNSNIELITKINDKTLSSISENIRKYIELDNVMEMVDKASLDHVVDDSLGNNESV